MKKYILLLVSILFISCKTENDNLKTILGEAIGTTFSIKYLDKSDADYSVQIDSVIKAVNNSLSTYIPTSDISKINKGDTTVVVDDFFVEVFRKSARIYQETNGEFDPTVGILVNAWGFGPGKKIENLDSLKVKELLTYVGFNKVRLENRKIYKQYPEIYFDFNAIAKGSLVDAVGKLFEKNGIANYMVEIGGEIRARGVNHENVPWKIAIENPNFDGSRTIATVIELKDASIASSGNYRKYRIANDGTKFVHTINTKTGYAKESNLLSASVISTSDCADVDAYATALMAMGLEKSKVFLNEHTKLKAFLIFADNEGNLKTYKTANFDE